MKEKVKVIEITAPNFGCYIVTFMRFKVGKNGNSKNFSLKQYGYNRIMTDVQLNRVHRAQAYIIDRARQYLQSIQE